MEFQLSYLGFDGKHQDCSSASVYSVEDETSMKHSQIIEKENDFPTSSTPVHQRLDDSGYLSMQRDMASTTSRKRRFSFFRMEKSFDEDISFESPQKRLHEDCLTFSETGSISKLDDDFLSNLKVVERLRFETSSDIVSPSCTTDQDIVKVQSKSELSSDVENSFIQLELCTKESVPDADVAKSKNDHSLRSFDAERFTWLELRKISGRDKDVSHQKVLSESADCISTLYRQNCYGVLSSVFSYLSGKDLTSASVVCHEWRNAICDDWSSRKRKAAYLRKYKRMSRENRPPHYFKPQKKEVRRVGILEDVLNISHINNKTNLKTKCDVGNGKLLQENHTQYIKPPEKRFLQAKIFGDMFNVNDKNDELDSKAKCNMANTPSLQVANKPIERKFERKCPACALDCEIQAEGLKIICQSKSCQHEFCAKCLGPYNLRHVCSAFSRLEKDFKEVIGSKKSKRNLRRL